MKPPTRLAIVGASVRAAAQSALRAGFEVVGADLFADADLDDVCPITRIADYPDGLADWLNQQTIDAWMYTGALENYPDLVDRMAAIAPLWGASGDALRRCRDPLELQQACCEAGLDFPDTRYLADVTSFEEGWLGKTYKHSGGVGVWRLSTDADRERHPDAYAQRIVTGIPIAVLYAVSEKNSALLGVTEQLVSDDPSDRGYVGSFGPTPCEPRMLERLGRLLREELGLRGLVGVDLMAESGRATVVEVNPRFTASVEVLERSCERSAIVALSEASSERTIAPWPAVTDRCVGKWVVFARHDVTITPAFAEWSCDELRAGRFGDRPRAGERIAAGRPVCTLLVEGNSESVVRGTLREAIRDAEHRLYEACDLG